MSICEYEIADIESDVVFDQVNKRILITFVSSDCLGTHGYGGRLLQIKVTKPGTNYLMKIEELSSVPSSHTLEVRFKKSDPSTNALAVGIKDNIPANGSSLIGLIIGSDDDRISKVSPNGKGIFNLEAMLADCPIISSDSQSDFIVYSK
jgi:hypothetical protein